MKFALALLVLAAGAAFTAPMARRMIIERRSAAVVDDLRAFMKAFQSYAHEHSNWPAAAPAPGTIPLGMETRLGTTGWQRATAIGGGYRWVRHTAQRGERYEAAILIVPTAESAVSDDRDQLAEIDRRIDDGDLMAGKFRLGYRDLPVFVIEH